jgi:hypothetical protein
MLACFLKLKIVLDGYIMPRKIGTNQARIDPGLIGSGYLFISPNPPAITGSHM